MKMPEALLFGAMTISIAFVPVFLSVPCAASSVEYSGASPWFAPDNAWSLYVGFFGVGDIIEWHWLSTAGSLSFSLLQQVDDTITQLWGFTNDDGYVVQCAGHYGLWWYNHDINGVYAYVSYWVAGFTPFTTVGSPSNGEYVDSKTITVCGQTDHYSSEVYVGCDVFHFIEASWVGDSWIVEGIVLEEGSNAVVVRTTYWLNSYGSKILVFDQTLVVTVDTVAPDLAITSPSHSAYLKSTVDVAWQCSDECGIAKREVRIDYWDWETVTQDSYHVVLADGTHIVSVRVTDLAGNERVKSAAIMCDSIAPNVVTTAPLMDTKISDDSILATWTGSDGLSGIDRYEISLNGGAWIAVGEDASYQLTGLDDGWHAFSVRAVDRSGNTATSTVSFGIYTSIWSTNGPYQGIPLFGLIAAIIIAAVLLAFLFRKRKGGPTVATVPPPPEPIPLTPP